VKFLGSGFLRRHGSRMRGVSIDLSKYHIELAAHMPVHKPHTNLSEKQRVSSTEPMWLTVGSWPATLYAVWV
jgi:hypothetical protein